jgi:hypothetical protein
MSPMSEPFLVAAATATRQVQDPAVGEAWERPSALRGMSVGALACHLADQLVNARNLLAAPASDQAPIPLLDHYRRAAWVRAGIDDKANVDIRTSAERSAVGGHAALVGQVTAALDELPGRLAGLDPGRSVLIPWQGWSLTLDDFLVTRMMEITVHGDDLAASLGQEPPSLPESVLGPVLGLLVGISLRRHGQSAVVRALSRAERAPATITAF